MGTLSTQHQGWSPPGKVSDKNSFLERAKVMRQAKNFTLVKVMTEAEVKISVLESE